MKRRAWKKSKAKQKSHIEIRNDLFTRKQVCNISTRHTQDTYRHRSKTTILTFYRSSQYNTIMVMSFLYYVMSMLMVTSTHNTPIHFSRARYDGIMYVIVTSLDRCLSLWSLHIFMYIYTHTQLSWIQQIESFRAHKKNRFAIVLAIWTPVLWMPCIYLYPPSPFVFVSLTLSLLLCFLRFHFYIIFLLPKNQCRFAHIKWELKDWKIKIDNNNKIIPAYIHRN